MNIETPLEANAQLPEGSKPCMRALDNPAMLAEPVVPLDASASNSWTDSSLVQMLTASSKVVSLVGVELVGTAARPSRQSSYRWYGVNQRFEHNGIVSIGTGDDQCQRGHRAGLR